MIMRDQQCLQPTTTSQASPARLYARASASAAQTAGRPQPARVRRGPGRGRTAAAQRGRNRRDRELARARMHGQVARAAAAAARRLERVVRRAGGQACARAHVDRVPMQDQLLFTFSRVCRAVLDSVPVRGAQRPAVALLNSTPAV